MAKEKSQRLDVFIVEKIVTHRSIKRKVGDTSYNQIELLIKWEGY